MFAFENAFDPIINQAAAKYDVPVALIKAVIGKESSFNPKSFAKDMKGSQVVAVSYGLMQLTWNTAVWLGFPNDTSRYMELMKPEVNIPLGVKYLSILMKRYGFTTPEDIYAAYNGGPDEPKKKDADGNYLNPNVQEHVEQFMPIYEYFAETEAGEPSITRP